MMALLVTTLSYSINTRDYHVIKMITKNSRDTFVVSIRVLFSSLQVESSTISETSVQRIDTSLKVTFLLKQKESQCG